MLETLAMLDKQIIKQLKMSEMSEMSDSWIIKQLEKLDKSQLQQNTAKMHSITEIAQVIK